jgi:hypothetical protein
LHAVIGSPTIAPHYFDYFQSIPMQRLPARQDDHPYHDTDAVFARVFYRAIFPPDPVGQILVLLLAIRGMRRARRFASSHRLVNLKLWTSIIATLLVRVLEVPGLGFVIRMNAGRRVPSILA